MKHAPIADEVASAFIERARARLNSPNGTSEAIRDLVQAAVVLPPNSTTMMLLALAASKAAGSPMEYGVALKLGQRGLTLAPNDADVWQCIGMIHRNMARADLALPALVKAFALDSTLLKAARLVATISVELGHEEVARDHATKVLAVSPEDAEMLAIRTELGPTKKSTKARRLSDRYPETLSDIADFSGAVSEHLFEKVDLPRILRRDSRIFAAGSCFATNIASQLQRRGYHTVANNFGEAINSTLANRAYFDWLATETAEPSEITKVVSPDQREPARQALISSDIVVLTVGVAPVFLDRQSGALRLPDDDAMGVRRLLRESEFRTLSVTENTANLLHIVSQIRKLNPTTTVFLTVSPVPLTVSFEYGSAVVADCVSKSILRASVDEVMRENIQNIAYWPAFEAVRWIGGYHGDMFGEDDGSTRHVSDRVVRGITSQFIQRIQVLP